MLGSLTHGRTKLRMSARSRHRSLAPMRRWLRSSRPKRGCFWGREGLCLQGVNTVLKQTPENRHSDTNTNTDDGLRDFVLDLLDDTENFRQKIN